MRVIALAAWINETEYPRIRFDKTCRFRKMAKGNNEPKEKIQYRRSGRSASSTGHEGGKLEKNVSFGEELNT